MTRLAGFAVRRTNYLIKTKAAAKIKKAGVHSDPAFSVRNHSSLARAIYTSFDVNAETIF
jgi:hypothetical protein